MLRVLSLLALLALNGCASVADLATAPKGEAVQPPAAEAVLPAQPEPVAAPRPSCPPLPAGIGAEASRLTAPGPGMAGALVVSEVEKNRRLAEAVSAYEACRKLAAQ